MFSLAHGATLQSVTSNHHATFDLRSIYGTEWIKKWLAAPGEVFPCYLLSLAAWFSFLCVRCFTS